MRVPVSLVALLPLALASPAVFDHDDFQQVRLEDVHITSQETLHAQKRAPQLSWGSTMDYWLAVINALTAGYYKKPSLEESTTSTTTTSMTPTDDSGRSQMLDDSPYLSCTGFLVCEQCPNDPRCLDSSSPESSQEDWTPSTSEVDRQPTPIPSSSSSVAVSEPSTTLLSVPKINSCPLQKCGAGPNGGCGSNARCLKGYCACPFALKAQPDSSSMVRYGNSLGDMSVYVDPGVKCDAACDNLFCNEVQMVSACFVPPEKMLSVRKRQGDNEPMGIMSFDGDGGNGDFEDDNAPMQTNELGVVTSVPANEGDMAEKLKGAQGVLLCDDSLQDLLGD